MDIIFKPERTWLCVRVVRTRRLSSPEHHWVIVRQRADPNMLCLTFSFMVTQIFCSSRLYLNQGVQTAEHQVSRVMRQLA